MKCIGLLSSLLLVIFCGCDQPAANKESKLVDTDSVSGEELVQKAYRVKKEASIPLEWASRQFANLKLDTLYKPANFTSPTFLKGDFNGDAATDIAFLIINKRTKEKGILLLHKGKPQEYYIMGAGNEVNGMTDLNWIEIFEKIPKGESIAETLVDEETGDILGPDSLHAIVLKTEAINTHLAEECGGGIIYWNKNKYEWMHQE